MTKRDVIHYVFRCVNVFQKIIFTQILNFKTEKKYFVTDFVFFSFVFFYITLNITPAQPQPFKKKAN